MHPSRTNARNARATEAGGTETNASGKIAVCFIKPGNYMEKSLGFSGITKCCIRVCNGSGIVLTGGSRNNTTGINKNFNYNVCSRTLS